MTRQKIFVMVLSVLMIFGLATTVFADALEQVTAYLMPGVNLELNEEEKVLPDDYEILNYADRTYLPNRYIAEELGANVSWDVQTETISINMMDKLSAAETISAEWNQSGKPFMDGYPARRDSCAVCHDGQVFSTGEFVEDAEFEEENLHVSGIDCQACHTGFGKEMIDSGVVREADLDEHGINSFIDGEYEAGSGAQCTFCHIGRQDPSDNYASFQEEAEGGGFAHQVAPAPLTTGEGGMEYTDVDYGSTGAHANLDDTCVSCHMAETDEGYKKHTFDMDVADIDNACGDCHGDWTEFDETGFGHQVDQNLELLEDAIKDELGADDINWGRSTAHTTVTLEDGTETDLDGVDIEVYVAAYNYYLISNDGGAYVHNPAYVRDLMSESYEALTGEELSW